MNQRILDILNRFLNEESISESDLKSFMNNEIFASLKDCDIVKRESKGRGFVWKLINKDSFLEIRKHYFPNADKMELELNNKRKENIIKFRNSKAKKRESYRMAFVRTKEKVYVNNKQIEVNEPLGFQINSLSCEKICFVENLENFFDDKFFKDGFTMLYPNGRIGKELLIRINSKEVIHWGDYDIEGLKEYSRIKEVFPYAKFDMPTDYYNSADRYGFKLNSNQIPSIKLLKLIEKDNEIKKLFDYLQQNHLFLEQEYYNE